MTNTSLLLKSRCSGETGFTLIELVVVIVILGILAAVALPKFVDLRSDASNAATQGVAGAISSASSINYSARKISASKGIAITTCTDAANLVQGGLPSGYSIVPTPPIPPDATVDCLVQGLNSSTALASVTGIN